MRVLLILVWVSYYGGIATTTLPMETLLDCQISAAKIESDALANRRHSVYGYCLEQGSVDKTNTPAS